MDTNSKSIEIIHETPLPKRRLLYAAWLKVFAFFASVIAFLIGAGYLFQLVVVVPQFTIDLIWNPPTGYNTYRHTTDVEYLWRARDFGIWSIKVIAVFWVIALLLLVYQTFAAGRRPSSNAIHRTWFDKLPVDFMAFVVSGFSMLCAVGIWDYLRYTIRLPELVSLMFIMTLITSPLLLFYLSCVKNIKNKTFWKNTLIYVVFSGCWKAVKNGAKLIVQATPIQWLACVSTAVTGFFLYLIGILGMQTRAIEFYFFLMLVMLASCIYALLRYTKHLTSLREKDLQEAISTAVKSERMRSELITNVSHDLRTPLTSIVTYVDLLKTEGLDAPDAPQYLDIVEQKAHRLQQLTEDLVEASKAASGSMTVNWELVNLVALVNQAMGELNDRIEAAKLDFRVSMSDLPPVIRADGRMMWRILENLFSNALKYALPGTRVYITVENTQTGAVLTMKNISASPLTTDPAELTERFTRGDESRSSEGSGLGLSIVLSMTKLQGGVCEIQTDGDLFKVVLTFPIAGSTPTVTPLAPRRSFPLVERLFKT